MTPIATTAKSLTSQALASIITGLREPTADEIAAAFHEVRWWRKTNSGLFNLPTDLPDCINPGLRTEFSAPPKRKGRKK